MKARCSLYLEQAAQCGQWVIAVGFDLVDFINDYERVGHGLAEDDDSRAVKTAELIKAEQTADKFRQDCNRFSTRKLSIEAFNNPAIEPAAWARLKKSPSGLSRLSSQVFAAV